MKRCVTVAALALLAAPAFATDVGVSVSVSQPGVYGRIDIGKFPQPQVVVAEPVIIARPRVVVAQPVQPVYMWVPPGHQKNWGKHCHRYGACGTPVYFVQEDWYQSNVMHGGQGGHEGGGGKHGGKGHGKQGGGNGKHGGGHGKGKDRG